MNYIGVDGCRAGWIAVTKDRDELKYRIYPCAQDLVATFPNAERILIDIPIGLAWKASPIRPCDRLAREILGLRRSSVLPVPYRDAAYASSLESIACFRRPNARRAATSTRLEWNTGRA